MLSRWVARFQRAENSVVAFDKNEDLSRRYSAVKSADGSSRRAASVKDV